MIEVRHILGISGGKDSAALAIYLKQKYPLYPLEYVQFRTTGCELEETEQLLHRLEAYLGTIRRLPRAERESRTHSFPSFSQSLRWFSALPAGTLVYTKDEARRI